MAKRKPHQDEDAHPFRETRLFHPGDLFLREAKPPFVIEQRRKGQEPKWRRFVKGQWVLFGQREAMKIAERELCGE